MEAPDATQPPLSSTPPPLDVTPTVDRWREKLLDFSARNRALFYRPTQRTVTLHLPERELWRLLSDEMTSLPLDLTDDLLLTAEANRPDAPQDARLRSLEAAKGRLRGLQSAARTFLEEQGVHERLRVVTPQLPLVGVLLLGDQQPLAAGLRGLTD